MRITNISFKKTVNTGKYENETLEMNAILDTGDNVDLAVIALMQRTYRHLDIKWDKQIIESTPKNELEAMGHDTTRVSKPAPKKAKEVKKDIEERKEKKVEEPKVEATTGDEEVKINEEPKLDKLEVEKPEEPKVKRIKKEERQVKAEAKEVAKKEVKKKRGTISYDRSKKLHKSEFLSLVTSKLPNWQEYAAQLKEISVAMEGTPMFNKKTKEILESFVVELYSRLENVIS